MVLDLVKSNNDKFGFVEKYRAYHAVGYFTESHLVGVNGDSLYIEAPYSFRGGYFEDLVDVESRIGLDSFLKAKKPIYSLLNPSTIIVDMKIARETISGGYLPDKSVYKVYVINNIFRGDSSKYLVQLAQLSVGPSSPILSGLHKLGEKHSSVGLSRKDFLIARMSM